MGKKQFAAIAFDSKHEVFVDYITFINRTSDMYPLCKAQIVFLKIDEAAISVLTKDANFLISSLKI